MYVFLSTSAARHFNAIQTLDEHLRADIGLTARDTMPGSPSHAAPAAARRTIADNIRTSARAFALPLALPGTSLG